MNRKTSNDRLEKAKRSKTNDRLETQKDREERAV
jgi:hypothetical protein